MRLLGQMIVLIKKHAESNLSEFSEMYHRAGSGLGFTVGLSF